MLSLLSLALFQSLTSGLFLLHTQNHILLNIRCIQVLNVGFSGKIRIVHDLRCASIFEVEKSVKYMSYEV
jgi:hypothetical protein